MGQLTSKKSSSVLDAIKKLKDLKEDLLNHGMLEKIKQLVIERDIPLSEEETKQALARCTSVLEWYANKEHYEDITPILEDNGRRAQAALTSNKKRLWR